MNYTELCKYVFSEERVDWELHATESRKRELVLARQISVYLGNWFFPEIINRDLAGIFGKDHAIATHSIKAIKSLLYSDKNLRIRIDKYLRIIREKIKEENQKEVLQAVKEQQMRDKLMESIASMELIAKVYCDITGMQLTKKAS